MLLRLCNLLRPEATLSFAELSNPGNVVLELLNLLYLSTTKNRKRSKHHCMMMRQGVAVDCSPAVC